MGYRVLITLDLTEASGEQYIIFHKKLEEFRWARIENLRNTWKLSFRDGVNRPAIVAMVKADLEEAIAISGVSKVQYSFQMDYNADVVVGQL